MSENNNTDLNTLKQTLITNFKNYIENEEEFCKDNILLLELLPKVLKLQNDKGRLYGRSFLKHGDISVFMNVERKFDRISNIMTKAMKEGTDTLHSKESATPTETFLDTIVDLGLYSLMWAGYIKETHPEEFEMFINSNNL